jgi:transcriptional regulator with XRE-family HTH domain
MIGERLRALREYRALSQGDMEKRLGVSRFYVSRVENGHTMPTLETLARFARALEVPVFHIVGEENDSCQLPILSASTKSILASANLSKKELRLLSQFNLLFRKLRDRDRRLLVALARRMIGRVSRRSSPGNMSKPEDKARP